MTICHQWHMKIVRKQLKNVSGKVLTHQLLVAIETCTPTGQLHQKTDVETEPDATEEELLATLAEENEEES